MKVIPKRLAVPKKTIINRLRFGHVSVMGWSEAFKHCGYRLAIHGSTVDLLASREKASICDLDLIAYITNGTGHDARTLAELLVNGPMFELKDRATGRPFGYQAKGGNLGGTLTQWSFTIYTDHPPVSTFDNVAHSQLLFLDTMELISKYGDTALMLYLKSTRQLFIPDGCEVSRLHIRAAHRETCGYQCLNPIVDQRIFDAGGPILDPKRLVAELHTTFQDHFSESDTASFLRLFFFAYSRIERFSQNKADNFLVWNCVSDHIADHVHLTFRLPTEFACYLNQQGIVPGALAQLVTPTLNHDAILTTQAALNECSNNDSRAHIRSDFEKMILKVSIPTVDPKTVELPPPLDIPPAIDIDQQNTEASTHEIVARLVKQLQTVSKKKKLLNAELPSISIANIRGPFTATSPEIILGGIVGEILSRGVEINAGLPLLKVLIPETVPGSQLAELLPQLLPIYVSARVYNPQIAPELVTWAIRFGNISDRTRVLQGLSRLYSDPAYYLQSKTIASKILTFKEAKTYVRECATNIDWIRKEHVPVILDILAVHLGKRTRTIIDLPRFILRHRSVDADTQIPLLQRWCNSVDVANSDPELFLEQIDKLSKSSPAAVNEFLPPIWQSLELTPKWTPFHSLITTCIPIQLRIDSESWGQIVGLLGDHRMPRGVVDDLANLLVTRWHHDHPDWPESPSTIQAMVSGVVRTLHPKSVDESLRWLNTAVLNYSAAPIVTDAILGSFQWVEPDLACRFCLNLSAQTTFPEVRELILDAALRIPMVHLSGERHFELLDRLIRNTPTDDRRIIERFGTAASKLGKLLTRDHMNKIVQWGNSQSDHTIDELLTVTATQAPRFLDRFPIDSINRYIRGDVGGADQPQYEDRLKQIMKHVTLSDAWHFTAQYLDAYPGRVSQFIAGVKFELVDYGFQAIAKSTKSISELQNWLPLMDIGLKRSMNLAQLLGPHFQDLERSPSRPELLSGYPNIKVAFIEYQKKKTAADKKEFQTTLVKLKGNFQKQMDQLHTELSTASKQHPDRFSTEKSQQLVNDFLKIDDLKMQRAILDTKFTWGREFQKFEVIPIIAQDIPCLERLKTDHAMRPVLIVHEHFAISAPLQNDNAEFLNYLLRHGLDPNMTFIDLNRNEVSIFEYAARCKSKKCMNLLLESPVFVLDSKPNLMSVVVILAVLGDFESIEYIESRQPISRSEEACKTRMSQFFRLFLSKKSLLYRNQSTAEDRINGLKYLLSRNLVSFNYPVKFNFGHNVKPLSAALMFEATNEVHYDPDHGLSATFVQCGATFNTEIRLDLLFIYAHALMESVQNNHLKLLLKTKFAELGPTPPIEAIRGFLGPVAK